jgi:peroxidase
MAQRPYSSWLRLDSASAPSRHRLANRKPRFEPLESRQLLSADPLFAPTGPTVSETRSIDGTGNNLANPTWGAAGSDLLRTAPAAYADGASAPAGADRPSAREISNVIVAQPPDTPTNSREMSAFVYAWGQFIDHDIDQTTSGSDAFNVQVPEGDPSFDPSGTGTQQISLNRSNYDPATGKDTPRQQVNSITSYLDGSMIYGSDATRAAALRTMVGGRLKTSDGDLLPLNTMGLANDNPIGAPASSLFVAGDTRANENSELTALQTLFMREHNRLADRYAAANPNWGDEQVFQAARRVVIGELQAITYNEFLPALVGFRGAGGYRGYDPGVNAGIANEFSTAAFRMGHSLVGDDVELLDNNGNALADPVDLSADFFNPAVVSKWGIDPILKYLASDRAQEFDTHVVDELRNFLFGQPGQGGLDLASLNIQRGRDHGLADYNSTRVAYGLPAVTDFSQITHDVALQDQLKAEYGNVNNIDLWVGGLAEDHVSGGSVGPLFAKIITDQFARLRDGDRLWYERSFSGMDLVRLRHTTLADVIERNTDLTNLQSNVFFFHAAVAGSVFVDGNGNGRLDMRERPLAGVTVELLDANGAVMATTRTNGMGMYSFRSLDLGSYSVVVVPPGGGGWTVQPAEFTITRGQRVFANLAVHVKSATPKPAATTAAADVALDCLAGPSSLAASDPHGGKGPLAVRR